MVTFKDYLAERKAGYDAQGDFVRLAMSDPAFPGITSLEELTAYIERRGGYHEVEAGRAVWDEFIVKQRELARNAKNA